MYVARKFVNSHLLRVRSYPQSHLHEEQIELIPLFSRPSCFRRQSPRAAKSSVSGITRRGRSTSCYFPVLMPIKSPVRLLIFLIPAGG